MEGGREGKDEKYLLRQRNWGSFPLLHLPAGLMEEPKETFTSLSELEMAFPGEEPLNQNYCELAELSEDF